MANNGIMFRFENADAEAMTAEDTNEAVALSAEADVAVDEQLGASEELSQVETGIEQAGEAQEELGEVIETVEEAAEDGGMTEREAVHLEARIANIARLLGTTPSAMGLTFRRESFGKSQNRLTATKYKLEALKEWPKKIWEALVKAWNWLKNAVSDFIKSFSSNAEVVEKALVDQSTRIKNAKNGELKKKEMTAHVKFFSTGGKTDLSTIKALLTAPARINNITKEMVNISSKRIEDMATDKNGLSEYFGTLHSIFGTGKGEKNFGLRVGGGQAIKSEEKTATIGKTEVQVTSFDIKSIDDKFAESYNAFTQSELQTINNLAHSAAKDLVVLQKTLPTLEKEIDNNINFCKNQIGIAGKALENDDDKSAKDLREQLEFSRIANQTSINVIKLVVNRLPSAALTIVKNAKDLVDAGIGNIKPEEKTAKK